MRRLLVPLVVATIVFAAAGIWVAVAPGDNRWLGSDPMLGEFLIGVLPVVTAVATLCVWWRVRDAG